MEGKIKFKNYLNKLSISRVDVGNVLDDILEFSSAEYFSTSGGLVDSDGEITRFDDILLGCMDKLNKQITSGQYSGLRLHNLETAKALLRQFKDNLINYQICPVCGKKLEVVGVKFSTEPKFDIDLFNPKTSLKCSNCSYNIAEHKG